MSKAQAGILCPCENLKILTFKAPTGTSPTVVKWYCRNCGSKLQSTIKSGTQLHHIDHETIAINESAILKKQLKYKKELMRGNS